MRSLLILLSIIGISFTKTNPTKCIATWYNMHGAKTASGQRMHRDSLTAAYNYAPFGTMIKVTNSSNKKSCIVKITDRMGVKGKGKIDLSYAAFGSIAKHSEGRIKVEIEIIK
jgi:rare lipoprotein A